MTRLNTLLETLRATDEKLDGILANDSLTETQQKEHDELLESRAKTLKGIEAEKAALTRAQERQQLEAEFARIEPVKPTPPPRKTQPDVPTGATKARLDSDGRVTSYYEPTDETVTLRFGNSPDAQRHLSFIEQRQRNAQALRESGYTTWGEFKSAKDFIRAGLDKDGRGGHGNHIFRDRLQKHYAAIQGMSEAVGSDGGYLVMPEFASGIMDRVYSNDLWSRTDNYTVSGNSMTFLANAETSRATGSRHGGLRGYWLGEGATKTDSKPTFRSITLKLNKLAVLVYLTDELLEDSAYALEQYIARKAAEEFNFMIGDALINGTGVGQPLGILTAPSLISVAKETGQAADTLITENIIKMWSRRYGPNTSRMVWLHNQDIDPQLHLMTIGVGTGGQVVYMPPGGLSSAPYATLMGRPMVQTEFNPTLGDQGDIILADMSQILSISKGGIQQAVSIHVEFLTDQTAVRFVMRLGATPWETAPVTPYKGTANTQSNFVTLDARA